MSYAVVDESNQALTTEDGRMIVLGDVDYIVVWPQVDDLATYARITRTSNENGLEYLSIDSGLPLWVSDEPAEEDWYRFVRNGDRTIADVPYSCFYDNSVSVTVTNYIVMLVDGDITTLEPTVFLVPNDLQGSGGKGGGTAAGAATFTAIFQMYSKGNRFSRGG